MNRVSPDSRPHSPIALCGRCRQDLLPAMSRQQWRKDMWRSAADGMVETPDAKAEKVKRRKARKAGLRKAVRQGDWQAAVTLFRSGSAMRPAVVTDEECPRCLTLQRKAA